MPDRLQTPRAVRPLGHTGQTGLFRLLPILVVNTIEDSRLETLQDHAVSALDLAVSSLVRHSGPVDLDVEFVT